MSTNNYIADGVASVSNDITVDSNAGGTWGWGWGGTASSWFCGHCGTWGHGPHTHITAEPRCSFGTADHDFAQLKIPGGGKPRLFCRRCATTRNV